MKFLAQLRTLALLASAGLLAACGGGGGGSTGSLSLAMTDAPSCGYDLVNVTVDRVRVHQSASAGDGDAGWSEIVLSPARRIDLLGLTNGVLEELGQTALPAGKYTQMRLVLVSNASVPMSNTVKPTGGSEIELDTPSGSQSGLKMNVDITVEAGKVADFVLDFDACKSVVKRGGSGHYNLKPVISVIPRISDAGQHVVGYVEPALATATTTVSVQQAGIVVKATRPSTDSATLGKFVLYPVPAGTYDLVVSAPGRVTALISGVPATTTAWTYVGGTGNRIVPPTSAGSQTAGGTVTVGGSAVDTNATVRALQTYTSGTVVETAGMPADAADGSYLFSLPTGAPAYTAYNADAAVAISFSQDGPRAGLFKMEARVPGQTPQLGPEVDLGTGPATTNFSF